MLVEVVLELGRQDLRQLIYATGGGGLGAFDQVEGEGQVHSERPVRNVSRYRSYHTNITIPRMGKRVNHPTFLDHKRTSACRRVVREARPVGGQGLDRVSSPLEGNFETIWRVGAAASARLRGGGVWARSKPSIDSLALGWLYFSRWASSSNSTRVIENSGTRPVTPP